MNIRQCTICETKAAGRPPRVNPRLCSDCQDWDDILHVTLCREKTQSHVPLDPVLFSYKHNPSWPSKSPNSAAGYSEPKELKFYSSDYFAARRDYCMMCLELGDALQRASSESEGHETKLAVWRPFIFDPSRNQWNVRDEQTAAEKGMVPWLQKCVLAICIATVPVDEGSWSYQSQILELGFRYEKWCYDLSGIVPWDRKVMEMSQIMKWLDRCIHEHGEACNSSWIPSSIELPQSFRLIDVRERRVVLPRSKVEYVALSYVWNSASASPEKQKLQLQSENLYDLEQPDSLNDAVLPEAVADAIHLCIEIGQKYLWVDRFCIVQDDLDLKTEQIDAMGVIYDRAFLTIVALGDGPIPGLPGLSCRPRQRSLQNWSWDLLAPMLNSVGEARIPFIDMALSKSRWNDRAWTFQERLFSKRRIYFDAGHVYGNCSKERWQEKPEDEDETEWAMTISGQPQGMLYRPSELSPDSFTAYSGIISQYTPRKLTFPEDILRAFAGVGNVLEMKLNRPNLLGHPEEFFTESLRWVPRPGFMGTRRLLDSIPSWSWASWDGSATWNEDWTVVPGSFLGSHVSEVKASFVNFYVSDPEEGMRRVKERHQPLELYLVEQKRAALKVIKEAATSWWPPSRSDDPMIVKVEELDELTKQVWDWAHHKAQGKDAAHPWPPSTARTPRTEKLHDLTEDSTAFAALRNLEEHTDTRWWPTTTAKDSETGRQLEIVTRKVWTLAEERPNTIVFNTACAYLTMVPFVRSWYIIPPGRHLSGCAIINQEGIPIGITMAMAPKLALDMFHKGRDYLVALIGVCSSKRNMQWDNGERSRLPIHTLNELCLLVMIMEEKHGYGGVYRRLAVGVVYSDEWMKLQPQWKTVALA
ncbi:heterokaryon incompatibility protein-domain-containing protein [Xylariaceae sp. AK1471]|nr:heterokaryon incompatibility protein-domain-containing protein [Xylariaceae sp. AK1471]